MADKGKNFSITISRQMGSLGYETAKIVGARLGFSIVWREIINQAARKAGAPEAALAAIDELGLFGICPSDEECHAYFAALTEVMCALADQSGLIIVGRAGQVILKGRPDVFHVRVIAPQVVRAERIAQANRISMSGAMAQVKQSDRFRKNYLKRFYGVNWNDPELYDLVINTGRTDATTAAELILLALGHWNQTQTHLDMGPEK